MATNATVEVTVQCVGMTLRDWFASVATDRDIAPYMEHESFFKSLTGNEYTGAQARYRFADAMLAEREKKANP